MRGLRIQKGRNQVKLEVKVQEQELMVQTVLRIKEEMSRERLKP